MSEQLAGRDLAWLERRRAELFGLISQVGDFRRGRAECCLAQMRQAELCVRPGYRGHGPQWNLTRRIGGKTVNVHLKPGPELEKAQREVAEHQRFAVLVEEVTAVSEAICAARPVAGQAAPPPAEGERGAHGKLAEIAAAEVGGWLRWLLACSASGAGSACWSRRCAPRWPRLARGCWRPCWPATVTGSRPAR